MLHTPLRRTSAHPNSERYRTGTRRGVVEAWSLRESSAWRRRWDSNPRIRVLQTLALPLGHVALQCLPLWEPDFQVLEGLGDLRWKTPERVWSGKRDSNPRPQPWQGCALPLSYSRFLAGKEYEWGTSLSTVSCCGFAENVQGFPTKNTRRRRARSQPSTRRLWVQE